MFNASISSILSMLRFKPRRERKYTKSLIKRVFEESPHLEVLTTSMQVSLNCPLAKHRMKLPCRGRTCTHLQCFDAGPYLEANELTYRHWRCPICGNSVAGSELEIDNYFLDMLESTEVRRSPVCNFVQVHKDGSWNTVSHKRKIEIIDLTGSDDDEPPKKCIKCTNSLNVITRTKSDN